VLGTETREMLTHRIEELLPRLRVPSPVIRGGRDFVVPQHWAGTVAQLAGSPPPVVVPGWGHAVQYSDPGSVATVLRRFVEELPTRR
jgi:pimeloyl-ACP methyl ester carboxylesterase